MSMMLFGVDAAHASQIAFLKMQSTRFAGEIADDAVNIFGGRGLTKTGQ